MYTRRHSRGRLGNFEGLGTSTLGQQAPGAEQPPAISITAKGSGGFLDIIKAVIPTAGAIYSQEQQMKHNQWLIKQGLAPTPLATPGAPAPYVAPPAAADNTPMLIGIAVVGLAAFMLFKK